MDRRKFLGSSIAAAVAAAVPAHADWEDVLYRPPNPFRLNANIREG